MKTAEELKLARWNKVHAPDGHVLRHALQAERLAVLEWTDAPGTIYPVHTHPFAQVRAVLRGCLRIGLPEIGQELVLNPGDRLDLPPETPHWEEVEGNQATVYLAATRVEDPHTDSSYSSAAAPKR